MDFGICIFKVLGIQHLHSQIPWNSASAFSNSWISRHRIPIFPKFHSLGRYTSRQWLTLKQGDFPIMPHQLYNTQLPLEWEHGDDARSRAPSHGSDEDEPHSYPAIHSDDDFDNLGGSDNGDIDVEEEVARPPDAVALVDGLIRVRRREQDLEMTDPPELSDVGEEELEGLEVGPELPAEAANLALDEDAPLFDDDDDILAGAAEPEAAQPHRPSSPPWDPFFEDDLTEEVPRIEQPFTMSAFYTGLALFVNKHNVSRDMYVELRQLLHLITPLPAEIKTLPKRVDTIKETLKNQLPLLKTRQRILNLNPHQLPTHSSHTEPMLTFDMRDVFRRMLHADALLNSGYFGMAHYVDAPTELWHSNS